MPESLQYLSLVQTVRHDVDVMVPRDDPVMSKRADECSHGHDVSHVCAAHGVLERVECFVESLEIIDTPWKEAPFQRNDMRPEFAS